MKEWQPIETCPKDDSQWLVYWAESLVGGPEIEIVSWVAYQQILSYGEPPATHWMPLPDPPTREASAKERA